MNDFELYPGKTLSGLFEDIYNNQTNKKKHISEVIAEMRRTVRHVNDLAVVGPLIKDLIDTSVKNDDLLLKLATIAQRIMVSGGEDSNMLLSDVERKQLLATLDEFDNKLKKESEIDNSIEDYLNISKK